MSYPIRTRVPATIVLSLLIALFLIPACGTEDIQAPQQSDDAADFGKQASNGGGGGVTSGGSYTGPGDTVPGRGPRSGCQRPPSCGSFTIPPNQLTADWTMTPSNYLTGIWPTVGQLTGYALVEYYFTVADYNALVAQQPNPNADGNYTIVAGPQSNTQEIFYVDNANFGAHAMAFDGTHGPIETICKGNFTLISHHYAFPPACTAGTGAISFSKSCMDNLLGSVNTNPGDILYVIAILYCSEDI